MQLAPLALGARHDLARVQARAAPVDVHLAHGPLGAVLGGGAGLVRLAAGLQVVGVSAVLGKQTVDKSKQTADMDPHLCPALQMQFMLWLSVTQNELGPHTTLEQGSRQNFSFLLGMVRQTSL